MGPYTPANFSKIDEEDIEHREHFKIDNQEEEHSAKKLAPIGGNTTFSPKT